MNKKSVVAIALVATFGLAGVATAAFNEVDGDQKFNGIVNWFPNGVKIGQQGSGGVTFFNGTIVNETTTDGNDNPVTVGDELRVDGRVFRGEKQGPAAISGDTFGPFIIDDDFEVRGNVSFEDGSTVDFTDVTVLGLGLDTTSYYNKTDIDQFLDEKADKMSVYSKDESDDLLGGKANKVDVYSKNDSDNLLDGKADTVDVYTKAETNTLLSGKSDTGHNHDSDYVSQSNPSWSAVTAHYAVSPIDFPTGVIATLFRDDTEMTTLLTFPGATLYGSLHLPDGATITELSMSAEDSSSGNVEVVIRRSAKDDTAAEELASAVSSGASGAVVEYTDTTISNAVIDNENYTYSVALTLPSFGLGAVSYLGGVVEYEIDSFN